MNRLSDSQINVILKWCRHSGLKMEMVFYEALIYYLIICSIHCYDMWASAGFTRSATSKTEDIDIITTITNQYGIDRVLTMLLLGGVEVFSTIYLLKLELVGGLC